MVIGISSGSAEVGTVGATCRRSGVTGISTPASLPSAPAQAPAALTTCRAAIEPAVVCHVRHPAGQALGDREAGHLGAEFEAHPQPPRGLHVAVQDVSGRMKPSIGQKEPPGFHPDAPPG